MKAQDVTVLHWLALMPILQGQGWGYEYAGQSRCLRNSKGQCPIIALADTLGEGDYRPWAFSIAAKDMLRHGTEGAVDKNGELAYTAIARAADNHPGYLATRRMLMQALGVVPDC